MTKEGEEVRKFWRKFRQKSKEILNKNAGVAIPQTAPKAEEPFHLWTDLSSGYERWDPRSA